MYSIIKALTLWCWRARNQCNKKWYLQDTSTENHLILDTKSLRTTTRTFHIENGKRRVDVLPINPAANWSDALQKPFVFLNVKLEHAVHARDLLDPLQVDGAQVLDRNRPPRLVGLDYI